MVQGLHGPNRTEYHCLMHSWSLHLCHYHAGIIINGVQAPIEPGYVRVLPPGTVTVCQYTEKARHLCAHFSFPDAKNDDEPQQQIRAVQDLNGNFGRIEQALEEGIASFPVSRRRAEVRLWDILWQLSEQPLPHELGLHAFPSHFEKAKDIIEERLSTRLNVAGIAAEVGLSHNQLTRLFRRHTGRTAVGYIRYRRLERAKHLLLNTTLSIKVIGDQVGMDDPSFFSKTFHAAFGASPQCLRKNAQQP
jgi:AraC-like DNA-binding protein